MSNSNRNIFIRVPEVTLPSGLVIPAFRVAQYISSRGTDGIAQSVSDAKPWVEINYHDARKACSDAGYDLITETRALAIACDIARQDINWTGGKVGERDLFQGLRKGSVSEAQAGTYKSPDTDERRWHQLSNGERIYDFAGNCFTWVFDDVNGDESGLTGIIAANSISLTSAPYPSKTKGMGWYPTGECDMDGYAPVRGGDWHDGSCVGAFHLNYFPPTDADADVGFRCTK